VSTRVEAPHLSAKFALGFVGETPCNDQRQGVAIWQAPVPVECPGSWLRSRERHGEPKRSPCKGDTLFYYCYHHHQYYYYYYYYYFGRNAFTGGSCSLDFVIIIIIIIIILEGMPSRAAHARRILISVPMRPITYRAV
jgi:hypothetical protein